MTIEVRGYKIRCYAKHGNRHHYVRLYESYSDERLAELEAEPNEFHLKKYYSDEVIHAINGERQ